MLTEMQELESIRLDLDYAQKQTSQAQAEITRLKAELDGARALLRKADVFLGAFEATCDDFVPRNLEELREMIQAELAKE